MRTLHIAPDGDEARRWAEEELAKPIYADAKPNAFDLWARDLAHFLADLFSADGGGQVGPFGIIIVALVVVAALVIALLYWGAPRRSRGTRRPNMDLLGASNNRSAAQLRADAQRRADAGDWEEATILRYRAVARSLWERDLIDPAPGATAQALAREAAGAFPSYAHALADAAGLFDDVRYLDHPGTAERYQRIADLDDALRAHAPEAVPA